MKKFSVVFLVLSCVIGSFAGVRIPTQAEVDEALNLWRTHCSGNQKEGMAGDNTFVYCKVSDEQQEKEESYMVTLPPNPKPPKQIIFVKPPPTLYRHKLRIAGETGRQETKIYVLPVKDSHDYVPDTEIATQSPAKPQLFFLNENHVGGTANSAVRPIVGTTVSTTEGYTYLPPRDSHFQQATQQQRFQYQFQQPGVVPYPRG